MADSKLSALSALTGANTDPAADLLYIDDVSATTGKKITVNELGIAIKRGWSFLSSQTASTSATIDFTTNLDDTFDKYMICFDNVKPATDDVYFGLRIGTGGGPTYQAGGGTTYGWCARNSSLSGGVDDGSGVSPMVVTCIALSRTTGAGYGIGNDTGEQITGVVEFSNPDASDYCLFKSRSSYIRSDTFIQSWDGAGNYGAASAITGIRFLFSSGNIASGTFRHYGLRKS